MPASAIDIDRPPGEVFAYVTDPSRFAEWQSGIADGRMDADGPPAVGARFLMTRRIGFAERTATSEVTQVDPPQTWGVRGVDGPVRAMVNVTVDALDAGRRSRVTVDIDFAGHGIGKILVPLVVRPQARREMPVNLQRLKYQLESTAMPGG